MRTWRWAGLAGVLSLLACGTAEMRAQTANHVKLMPQLGMAPLTGVVFSPDGRYVLTASDNTARLWDAQTGQQIRTFMDPMSYVVSVAFSPDARYVVMGNSMHTALLWDAKTGQQLRSFEGRIGRDTPVAFSPDGKYILTGTYNTAQLWEVATGRNVRAFAGHKAAITAVAFSPDGLYVLTGSDDRTARLWDAKKGKKRCVFEGHTDKVSSVAFSPDGRYVLTGSDDKTARLWDAGTGQAIRSFAGHTMRVAAVAFSPDGRHVLTGSDDATVQLWDASAGQPLRILNGHTNHVTSVAFSPDGRTVLTGSWDRAARLWDASTGQSLRIFAGHTDWVTCVAFSSDGRYVLTGGEDKTARLWDLVTGQQIRSFERLSDFVNSVTFSPDGRYVLTSSGKNAQLWDTGTDQPVRTLEGHTDTVFSAVFSPDGKYVLTGSADKTARLWDMRTGQLVRTFEGHTGAIGFVTFSPDGKYVLTGSADKTARLWDAGTGQLVRTFKGHTAQLGSVAFSSDGRYVITAGGLDKTARLWDTGTGQQIRTFAGHFGLVRIAEFSPDGRYVVTCSWDKTARLWDIKTGQQLRAFEGHTIHVNAVAFSPDGRYVLTGSDDTTSRLWDAQTGRQLAALMSFESDGWAVADADGRFDANDLDGAAPLSWVVDDDPMRALPLEIFMRDYYTPGLLARTLKGEKLSPIRSIAEIKNRVQPAVKVVSVTPAQTPGRVDVTVHAASVTDDKSIKSGLQDLRLFRDGQMVADGYREGVLKDGDFVFRDVMLKRDAKKVTFTAYAFNSERIKSATASFDYEVKTPVNTAVKRKAFLLQVGVNHTSASGCELKYSVNDAETMSSALSEKLRSQGFEVEAVKLESSATAGTTADPSAAPQDDKFMGGASKESIRAQLKEIAAQATPDDVFFMSFSGHGYSAAGGAFYVLPSSLEGDCAHVDDAMLKTAISADELADWLRPIDAGEMTLILDACYSAESVQAGDFKPGPMGSRGLGQVAYDKRMRVLAASQSDAVAHEYDYLHQGLLSYVLVKDGLDKDKADWKPKDGKITVGEWLSYAATAVPQFKPSAPTGENKGLTVETTAAGPKAAGQVPALFDFSRQDALMLVLAK